MINKIGKITVYVQDQEQAKDFWLNKIGFVLKLEQPMGPERNLVEVRTVVKTNLRLGSLFEVRNGTASTI